MKKCLNCGAEMGDGDQYCPQCGTRSEAETIVTEKVIKPLTPAYPMKWHNFLMVVMIISGVITVINGFTTISGLEYSRRGYDVSSVYSSFPGLQTADILYGAAMIGIGVLEVIVRNHLKAFRESGPRMLTAWYIITLIIQMIYLIAVSQLLKVNMLDASTWGSVGGTVLLLVINSIYYSRRKELFVN